MAEETAKKKNATSKANSKTKTTNTNSIKKTTVKKETSTKTKIEPELKKETVFTSETEVKTEVKTEPKEFNEAAHDLGEAARDFGASAKVKIEEMMDTEDTTTNYDNKDIETNKAMAILAYIPPLTLIPYFSEKNSKFVKYHTTQGMNLLIFSLIYAIVSGTLRSLIKINRTCELWGYNYNCGTVTPWWLEWPLEIIGLGITVLCIIGIVYVCQGKAKELPVVNKFKFFK